MNQENIILSQNPDFKFVEVSFQTPEVSVEDFMSGRVFDPTALAKGKTYTYKTLADIKVGDTILVVAPDGIKPVIVVRLPKLNQINPSIKYKWVYSTIDDSHYERGLLMEEKVREILIESETEKLRKELLETIPKVTQNKLLKLVTSGS